MKNSTIHTYSMRLITYMLSLFFLFPITAQTKRALLVGISDYESADELNVWPNIHGSNDATLMYSCLSEIGFEDCTCLLDGNATHSRIVKEFKALTDRTSLGDTIFFHFSGHGQPFEDLDGDEGTNDGWDESIIPYDALRYYDKDSYKGEHHITDDMLFDLLLEIRRKAGSNGMVYAVIDACFSGSVMRGDEDKDRFVSSIIGFCLNGYKEFTPTVNRKSFQKLKTIEHAAGLIAVEASLPFLRTREIKIGEQFYGPLTYYTVQSLRKYSLKYVDEWIHELQQSYKTDKRLMRETIFIESTVPLLSKP